MPTPIGWDTREPLCGENDPYGREDTANKYAKTLWQNFTAEHNPDGTHFVGGLLRMTSGSYVSQTGSQTITLGVPTLTIAALLITSRTTQLPILASASMPIGESKLFGTAALQTTGILSISTPGQFTVGTHAAVNAQGSSITYDYYAWGE